MSTNQTSPWPTSLPWNTHITHPSLKRGHPMTYKERPFSTNQSLCLKIKRTQAKVDSGVLLKPVSAAVWREPVLKSKNLFSAVISSWSKFKGLASQWLKKLGPAQIVGPAVIPALSRRQSLIALLVRRLVGNFTRRGV